jgi:hypothetical protein
MWKENRIPVYSFSAGIHNQEGKRITIPPAQWSQEFRKLKKLERELLLSPGAYSMMCET